MCRDRSRDPPRNVYKCTSKTRVVTGQLGGGGGRRRKGAHHHCFISPQAFIAACEVVPPRQAHLLQHPPLRQRPGWCVEQHPTSNVRHPAMGYDKPILAAMGPEPSTIGHTATNQCPMWCTTISIELLLLYMYVRQQNTAGEVCAQRANEEIQIVVSSSNKSSS